MARIHGCHVTSCEAMLFMKHEHYGKCKSSFKDSQRKCKYYNINAIKQSAYIVFDTIIVDDFAFLFNCMPLGWVSDSMMGLRHKAIH